MNIYETFRDRYQKSTPRIGLNATHGPKSISDIFNLSLDFSKLTTINYEGTKSEWAATFGYSNFDDWKEMNDFSGTFTPGYVYPTN